MLQHGIHSTNPDAAALAQLLCCPVLTLPAARLLRPLLPAATLALVHPANTLPTPLRVVALIRVLHIAPHLSDAMLPWLCEQEPPWTWMVNGAGQRDVGQLHGGSPKSGSMYTMPPASFVLLTVLHVLPMLPAVRTAWSPSLLVPLVLRGAGQHVGEQQGVRDDSTLHEHMEVDGGHAGDEQQQHEQQKNDNSVMQWAALQCLGWYLGLSDAALRCVWFFSREGGGGVTGAFCSVHVCEMMVGCTTPHIH